MTPNHPSLSRSMVTSLLRATRATTRALSLALPNLDLLAGLPGKGSEVQGAVGCLMEAQLVLLVHYRFAYTSLPKRHNNTRYAGGFAGCHSKRCTQTTALAEHRRSHSSPSVRRSAAAQTKPNCAGSALGQGYGDRGAASSCEILAHAADHRYSQLRSDTQRARQTSLCSFVLAQDPIPVQCCAGVAGARTNTEPLGQYQRIQFLRLIAGNNPWLISSLI